MDENRTSTNGSTRKFMTMHKTLHPRDNVNRPFVSRKGGRGYTNIQDSVDASIERLEDYIKKCGGRLITTTGNNTDNSSFNRTKITRKQKWKGKQLCGHSKRQTKEISHEKTSTWLRKGNFKRENGSLLITAQNNAIRTNYVKAKIANVNYVVIEMKRSIT